MNEKVRKSYEELVRQGKIADYVDMMNAYNRKKGEGAYNHDPEKGGIKHDADKLRVELVPPETILGLARILTHGAKKYDDWNWAKGMSWMRVYGALQRHLLAWLSGEDVDDESAELHLEHALCCLAFLHYYQVKNIGTDDRHRG